VVADQNTNRFVAAEARKVPTQIRALIVWRLGRSFHRSKDLGQVLGGDNELKALRNSEWES
jgi:hypothetical protein